MTKTEAIARIQSKLDALTPEQALALAEIATAWTRLPPPEDGETLAAIAEGLAQADCGEFVDPKKVADLMGQPWR